jgi:hypothetical protein
MKWQRLNNSIFERELSLSLRLMTLIAKTPTRPTGEGCPASCRESGPASPKPAEKHAGKGKK